MREITLKEAWTKDIDQSANTLDRTERAYYIPFGAPFTLPNGWSIVYDNLPSFDPELLNLKDPEHAFKLFQLSEDLWYAKSDDGEWGLDLGWYPEADPNGNFRAILIRGNSPENWQHPFYEFESRKMQDAIDWMRSILRQCFKP